MQKERNSWILWRWWRRGSGSGRGLLQNFWSSQEAKEEEKEALQLLRSSSFLIRSAALFLWSSCKFTFPIKSCTNSNFFPFFAQQVSSISSNIFRVTRSQRSTRRRRSVSPLTTEGNVEVQTTLSRRTTSTLAVTVSLTTEASGDSGVVGSHLVLIQSSTHMDTKRSRKRESVTRKWLFKPCYVVSSVYVTCCHHMIQYLPHFIIMLHDDIDHLFGLLQIKKEQ